MHANRKDNSIKSQGKLVNKISRSTTYSLLTGKKLINDEELHETIKRKRVKSYQKISFNIRKMDEMFKGQYRAKIRTQSNDPEAGNTEHSSPVRKKLKLNDKLQIISRDGSDKRMKTSYNFNQPANVKVPKGNIINRGELLDQVIVRKSQSNSKQQLLQANSRIKTQYSEQQSGFSPLQSQLLFRKQTLSPKKNQKESDLVKQLTNDKQESLFRIKKSIPGLKFKISQVLQTENSETDSVQRKNSFNGNRTVYIPGNQTFYMHRNQLLSRDSTQKVSQMYRLRTQYDLNESPKQWHLYDCFKLGQLSLYRTNLKLSCESWVLLDYLELKYLRGWHPKEQGEFNVVVRLLVARILLTLQKSNEIDFGNVRMKINNAVVRNKIEDNSAVLMDSEFSLNSNTVISLWDLFVGMLLTRKDDLVWHLIYALCHLFRHHNLQLQEKDPEIELEQIYIQNDKEKLRQYEQIFMLKVNQVCEQLRLQETTLELKKKKMDIKKNQKTVWGANSSNNIFKESSVYQYLLVKSSCIDVAILFVDCLRFPTFADTMMQAHPIYKCRVKHQIGYKFWQNRYHTFKNQYKAYNDKDLIVFVGRNQQSKMLTILAYHYTHKVVIVCNECKINMCLRDVSSIVEWMRETFKRFGGKGKKQTNRMNSLERSRSKE